ncbi:MAG: hypothetical protein A2046_06250 [Bacteroidetes bacterium GWA2_30_7]|nr:MAG: hypothetical protein A2046_06250 [Bacteroidetes bacterium GWA2_30_7]
MKLKTIKPAKPIKKAIPSKIAKKSEIKQVKDKYIELYDFAPSGYFTISKVGEIIELNLSGANMLGIERSLLKNRRFDFFISKESKLGFNLFIAKIFNSKVKETCELTLTINGDIQTYVHISGIASANGEECFLTMIDISNLKNNEEKLINSRTEWIETFDLIPDMITILDVNHRIVRANKASIEKLGISPQDLTGLNCYQCIHGKQESPSFCPHSLMLKDGKEHIADFHEQKLGMDLLVSVTPIKDKNGKITGSVHIARDITERKKKENELKKLNRTLNALSKSSQEMIHAKDEVHYLNEVCKIIINNCGYAMVWVGYAENDKDKTVRPVAFSGFEEGYLDTLKISWADSERGKGPTGTAIRTAKPAMCKDMTIDPAFKPWRYDAIKRGYASSIVFPLVNDSKAFGAITIYSIEPDSFSKEEVELLSELANDLAYGIISIRSRIAQKIAEEALIRSEEKYRLLFNEMIDGFAFHEVILNNDGEPCDYRFLSVNPAFEKMTGLKTNDIIGKTVLEVLPDTEIYWIEKYGEVALSGKSIEFENYSSPLQKHFKVCSFSPQKGFFAVIFEDITIRKNTEKAILERDEKLQKYAEELKESLATKDKFYKIIAHDLKNPFISLIGASELLYGNVEKFDTGKIAKLAKILNDSAKSGYEMLLNLLEWARSQTGSLVFNPEKINIKKLTKNYSNLIEYSNNKNINLNFNIDDDLHVIADKNMLDTILRNLIGNSLKFTPKGGEIIISTKEENNSVIIFVKDTGVGIAKSDLDKLFRTDIKFSLPGTEHEEGTGLGLLLCKEFVEKHGGKIWVESEENKGCTFYFTLCN